MRRKHNSRSPGFTLVELMVVIGIIAIMAAVAAPMYSSYVTKTRAEEGRAALAGVKAKQEVYRSTHFTYASALSDLPGYSADTETHGSYYNIQIVSGNRNAFRARAWDGQKSIGGKSAGSDEWIVTESVDTPCHTSYGYSTDETDPCTDDVALDEGGG